MVGLVEVHHVDEVLLEVEEHIHHMDMRKLLRNKEVARHIDDLFNLTPLNHCIHLMYAVSQDLRHCCISSSYY